MGIDRNPQAKVQRTVVSFIILFYLALQGSATFTMNWRFISYYFPFVNYPMYTATHYEGEHVRPGNIIVGRLDDNSEVEIHEKDLGLNYWQFRWGFGGAVLRGNQGEIVKYLLYYKGANGKRFTSLTVKSFPAIVTREGMRPSPPEDIRTVQLTYTDRE